MRYLAGLFVLSLLALTARWGDSLILSPSPYLMSLTIHDQKWTVLELQTLSNSQDDGDTSCATRIISIRKDVQGRGRAETFMHEAMHAIGCSDGVAHDQNWNNSDDITDGCEGHCGIYFGGRELAAFIADNPQFIEAIQQAYRDQGRQPDKAPAH